MSLPTVNISIFETILARRSVRNYKVRKVEQALIRTLLEAAIHAPTAIHQEPWGFVIIQDEKLLKQLSEVAKPLFLHDVEKLASETADEMLAFGQPEFNIFYNAGTLVLICGTTVTSFFEADCWLAAENFMLAASAMELGTCIIGSALPALNMPNIKEMLSIPDEYTVVAPVILGYSKDEPCLSPRNAPVILAKFPAAFDSNAD